MKFKINTNEKLKICPVCHRIYSKEHNYCSMEEQLVELIEVEFE